MKFPLWLKKRFQIYHKLSYKKGIDRLRQIRNMMVERDKKEVAFPTFENEAEEDHKARNIFLAVFILCAILFLLVLLAWWFGIERGGLLIREI